MLDIKFIRQNLDLVKTNCANRGVAVDIEMLLQKDEQKRQLQTKLQELQAARNQQSKDKPDEQEIAKRRQLSEEIDQLEEKTKALSTEIQAQLLAVPNLTHPEVKVSQNEEDKIVLFQRGQTPKFKFAPKDHLQLAAKLDLLDLERAAKVTGSKFYYLKNELALLELALVNYALGVIIKKGYAPLLTPDLARLEIIEALGFNPRGESTQVYQLQNTDLGLIGTAEITAGGLHSDEVLIAEDLPKKYAAVSHCFRTEAGAYSKFAKGLFRVHQFTKVEMFVYATPDKSELVLQEILEIQQEIFNGLDLPYRVIDHVTIDLANQSYRTFDLEVWLPGKPNQLGEAGDWAEVTSASNCTDYQARALNIKYQTANGEKALVHTLNGTGLAVPRVLIAILENYQRADGSVVIPKVLRTYLGGQKIIKS